MAQFDGAEANSAVRMDPSCWPQHATTVMLRNIPIRYTQEDLLEEFSSKGFDKAFDYFHLVMDMHSKRNKGFAFLNLRSPALARRIFNEYDGFHLERYKSKKVLNVTLAEVQGLQANAINYLNARGDRVHNVWFRPFIFATDETGEFRPLPLTPENLPEEVARVYGSRDSHQRADQRQRVLSVLNEVQNKGNGNGEIHCQGENSAVAEDQLLDGEYEEIDAQVQAFLASLLGSNENAEATLTVLAKPPRRRRKRAPKNQGNLPVLLHLSAGDLDCSVQM